MIAGEGCVVRSKFTKVSTSPGGPEEVEFMKDGSQMGSQTDQTEDGNDDGHAT